MKYYLIVLLFITHLASAQTIKSDDPHIRYTGRIFHKDGATVLSWAGMSAQLNFKGSSISATLADEHGQNFYNIIIDGKIYKKVQLMQGRQSYLLAAGLANTNHTLELFKRTEWVMGKTWVFDFGLPDGGHFLSPPEPKKRKLEFYGNSITCGYAVEDSSGQDRGTPPYEDNYVSYDALLARHYNADYACIARSGIGLTLSYFHQIMPEMYHLADGSDPSSEWDFNKLHPDIIIVDLFQNDAGLLQQPELAEYKVRFGHNPPTPEYIVSAYRNFVSDLRNKHPDAYIICTLGSMSAARPELPWVEYIKQAVSGLKDKKIYAWMLKYKGTPGHPNVKEQQDMADQLTRFIDGHIKW